jgi:hypothetical protein
MLNPKATAPASNSITIRRRLHCCLTKSNLSPSKYLENPHGIVLQELPPSADIPFNSDTWIISDCIAGSTAYNEYRQGMGYLLVSVLWTLDRSTDGIDAHQAGWFQELPKSLPGAVSSGEEAGEKVSEKANEKASQEANQQTN